MKKKKIISLKSKIDKCKIKKALPLKE